MLSALFRWCRRCSYKFQIVLGLLLFNFNVMAPEYVIRGHFSVKSDVYSFGVLVLEIVSGRKIGGRGIGDEGEDLLTYVSINNA